MSARLRLVFSLLAALSCSAPTLAADDVWVEETIRYDANGNVVEVVDAEGRITTRTYDDRDRLTSESAPLGKTTTYTYDGNDNRTSETRANPRGSGSQTRTIAYDDANRPVATTDAEGGVRRQVYDAAGNVIEKIDARGNATRFVYDTRNQPTTQTGPEAGQQIRYTYDKSGNTATETWANGRLLTYVYDVLDRLIRTEDEAGLVEARELNADGLPIDVEDADGRRTTIAYDDLHHPTTKRLPGAVDRTITTAYSIHGDLESQTDPRGHVTTHAYDTLGRRIGTTFPTVDGTTAAKVMTYDKVGNLTSKSNARGQVTNYVVNALNQRETQTDPTTDGVRYTQHWTYDAQGNALTHTDRRGILSVTAYDTENRIIGRARDGQILDTRTLDAEGNATTIADALGRETHLTYDKANRKVGEARPLQAIETWTYTPEGDIASHTDADARTTSYTYTNRRYLATETLAGETTTYTTNGSGQRLARQRPNGKTWTYTYDDAGRLSTVADPLTHTTTYGYDTSDNRTSVVDANDHATTFAYDARNRLATKTYPGGDAYAWKYDADGNGTEVRTPLGRTIATTYDALNRAIASTYTNPRPDEPASTTRRYDGNANVVAIDETIDGDIRTETRRYDPFDRVEQVTNPLNRRVAYRYDAVGNRTHLTDHDGQETSWSYDDLNRNVATLVPGQGATRQTHTKAGKLDTLTRPDGSSTEHTYDEAGRIASILHTKAGEPIATYAYRYDLNGNRIEQKETNGSTTNGEAITTYAYDDADRLTQVTELERTSTYTLDAVGNRTIEHVEADGTTISHSVLTYNARDQLTSRADNVANVHVTQTSANQLISTTKAGTTPQQRHYLLDALRSPIATLTQDGAVNSRTRYDAWGEIVAQQGTSGATTTPPRDGAIATLPATDEQPVGFTGYLKDSESGLYYAKARYYDPAVARFTTEDPEAGKDMEPPSLHRYLYAYANPTVYVDPTGRSSIDSPRRGLLDAIAYAPNERDREVARAALRQYEAERPAVARATAQGLAASALVGIPGAAYLRAAYGVGRAAYATYATRGAAAAAFDHGVAASTVAGVGIEAGVGLATGAMVPSAIPTVPASAVAAEARAASMLASAANDIPVPAQINRLSGADEAVAALETATAQSRAVVITEVADGPASLTFGELRALRTAGLSREEIVRHMELNGDIYMFRGTSPGWTGSPSAQATSTSASLDPYKATVFALEARSQAGEAVVQFGSRSDVGTFTRGNWFAAQEREVGVAGGAAQFAENAPHSISVDRSREILTELGMPSLPRAVTDSDDRRNWLESAPSMTPEQIAEYMRRARSSR